MLVNCHQIIFPKHYVTEILGQYLLFYLTLNLIPCSCITLNTLTLQGKNISELMSFSVWYRAPNVIVKKLTGQRCHCNSRHETLLILHKMINWRLEPHATFTVPAWKLATWSNSVYKDLFQDFIFTDWKGKGTILITYADLLYKTGHRTSRTNVNYGLINFILWQT